MAARWLLFGERMLIHVGIGLAFLLALVAPAAAQSAPPPPPPPPGYAPEPVATPPKTYTFQVGGGYLVGGDLTIEDDDGAYDASLDGGPVLTFAVDRLVNPRISLGLFASGIKSEVEGTGVAIITLGGTIKSRFHLSNGMQIRVGAALGYQRTSVDEDGGITIEGVDIAPILELAFSPNRSKSFTLQATAISQPSGGGDEVDVTFAPIPYIAGLLEL